MTNDVRFTCKQNHLNKDETYVSNINVNYTDFTGTCTLDHENIPIYKSTKFKKLSLMHCRKVKQLIQ